MPVSPSRRLPRFVYLSDSPGDHPGTQRFGWRLAAANNRPLGRGVRMHASLTECRAAATRVQRAVAESRPPTAVEVARGRWSWRITLDGLVAAVCVHPYLRRVECLRALEQFVGAIQVADPAAGVLRYFGPHSLKEFEPHIDTAAMVAGGGA